MKKRFMRKNRYYFWLGCSTSGALGLLAIYGPGDLAWQKHEHILPVKHEHILPIRNLD
jgi:hypothetical protein